MLKVKFKEWNCGLELGLSYGNGRRAIELFEVETKEPIAVATINLPEEHLEDDELFIKDYSENSGMLKCLSEAGVISQPIDWVQSGFVRIPKVKFLIQDPEI